MQDVTIVVNERSGRRFQDQCSRAVSASLRALTATRTCLLVMELDVPVADDPLRPDLGCATDDRDPELIESARLAVVLHRDRERTRRRTATDAGEADGPGRPVGVDRDDLDVGDRTI